MPLLYYIQLSDGAEDAEEESRVAARAVEKAAQGATDFHNKKAFPPYLILPFRWSRSAHLI